jgi:S-adenosylmethionine:tRNA ribosyltransferase-isomerase
VIDIGALDYDLPDEWIAQSPAEPRDSARLLVCRGDSVATEYCVADLPKLLSPGDLVVFNSTRTRRARTFARRIGGGKTELLFLRPSRPQKIEESSNFDRDLEDRPVEFWEVLARPSRKLSEGQVLALSEGDCCAIRMEENLGEGLWLVRIVASAHPVGEFFERHGYLPLPPYFHGRLDSEERYQTVFGDKEGSAAAPTAGLHFTHELLRRLQTGGIQTAFVYLEIGADTFRPLRDDGPHAGKVSKELCEVGEEAAESIRETKASGGRVVAVGTTVVRTLETFADSRGMVHAGQRFTDLFIETGC